jgi:hypothetical protein
LAWQSGSVFVDPVTRNVQNSVINATSFVLTPCLALNKIPAADRPRCVSLMTADWPEYYLRHYNFVLYLEPLSNPRNPTIFDVDGSFIIHYDLYYPGTAVFESVNYPGLYIRVLGDNSLKVEFIGANLKFGQSASFFLINPRGY